MNRVTRDMERMAAEGRKGLMPFICGGYPGPGATPDIIRAVAAGGADVIEVGIPFSDPIADGPVIASAMHDALASGATPGSVLDEIRTARSDTDVPIVAMVSASIVYRLGGSKAFCARCLDAGVDGLIVPDAPLEESATLMESAAGAGMTLSLLIAPTTPQERSAAIASKCSGFVYLLARTGLTGERSDAPEIGESVERLRPHARVPIACGFGISTPDHVREVVRYADAAIVGSALVRRQREAASRGGDAAEASGRFVRELSQGLSPAATAGA